MFDGLIQEFADYPVRRLRFDLQHLKENSSIVNNPHFETGIVRVQQGVRLSPQEEEAVKRFKKTADGAPVVVQSHADKYKNRRLQTIFQRSMFYVTRTYARDPTAERSMYMLFLVLNYFFFFSATGSTGTTQRLSTRLFTGTWKEERRRELPKKQQRLPLVQHMMTPTRTHRWLRAERPAES